MASTVRLSLRMVCRADALAEVIAAGTLAYQANVLHTDGEVMLFFALQEGGQLGDEVREDVANKGMVLLHELRVTGAARRRFKLKPDKKLTELPRARSPSWRPPGVQARRR